MCPDYVQNSIQKTTASARPRAPSKTENEVDDHPRRHSGSMVCQHFSCHRHSHHLQRERKGCRTMLHPKHIRKSALRQRHLQKQNGIAVIPRSNLPAIILQLQTNVRYCHSIGHFVSPTATCAIPCSSASNRSSRLLIMDTHLIPTCMMDGGFPQQLALSTRIVPASKYVISQSADRCF